MSYYSPQDSLSGSRKLSKVKTQRKVEDKSAYSTVRKEDDIKYKKNIFKFNFERKTISRARKSVHKKMETTRQERLTLNVNMIIKYFQILERSKTEKYWCSIRY